LFYFSYKRASTLEQRRGIFGKKKQKKKKKKKKLREN
jgi:hypothetical protein